MEAKGEGITEEGKEENSKQLRKGEREKEHKR